jgi:Crossover junction endodeoxyribonuclease RuvC
LAPHGVVGIDPGLAACGYGVVEGDGSKVQALAFGCWHTEVGARIELRLRALFLSVATLVERHRPDVVALEESFAGRNARSALSVGHVSAGDCEAGRVRLRAGGQGAGAADGEGAARAGTDADADARGGRARGRALPRHRSGASAAGRLKA